MVSTEVLAILISGLGITTSILYYTLTLRNQNRSRETQWVSQLLENKINEESMESFMDVMSANWIDIDDFLEKYDNTVNSRHAAIRNAKWSFYDMLGGFVKDRRLDVDLVYQFYNMRCLLMWFKYETVIKYYRLGTLDRDYMENFEYLADRMIEIRQRKGLNLPLSLLHPTSTLQGKYINR